MLPAVRLPLPLERSASVGRVGGSPRLIMSPRKSEIQALHDLWAAASVPGRRPAQAALLFDTAADGAIRLFGEDGVVVALAKLKKASSLRAQAAACGPGSGAAAHAARQNAWAAEKAAVAVLSRRSAAKTLLPGCLRPEEVEFARRVQSSHASAHAVNAACEGMSPPSMSPSTSSPSTADGVDATPPPDDPLLRPPPRASSAASSAASAAGLSALCAAAAAVVDRLASGFAAAEEDGLTAAKRAAVRRFVLDAIAAAKGAQSEFALAAERSLAKSIAAALKAPLPGGFEARAFRSQLAAAWGKPAEAAAPRARDVAATQSKALPTQCTA